MEIITPISFVSIVKQVYECVFMTGKTPCSDFVIYWPLEDHDTIVVPDLDEVFSTVSFDELFTLDFDKDRAHRKILILVAVLDYSEKLL